MVGEIMQTFEIPFDGVCALVHDSVGQVISSFVVSSFDMPEELCGSFGQMVAIFDEFLDSFMYVPENDSLRNVRSLTVCKVDGTGVVPGETHLNLCPLFVQDF